MRWTTLLVWNTLPNQSSDQHVLVFMYMKEEEVSQLFFIIWASGLDVISSHQQSTVQTCETILNTIEILPILVASNVI